MKTVSRILRLFGEQVQLSDGKLFNDSFRRESGGNDAIEIGDPGVVRAIARQSIKRDLLISIILFSVATSAFIWFDFFEWFFEFSRAHEEFELDELAASIPALAITMAWFASRRWRHAARATVLLENSLKRLLDASENLAEARDREEKASHVKSVFLSMMGHEMRTPMNGIIAPAEALLKSNLDDQQRAQATQVLQSSQFLLHSIDDILELAELESGPITVESDQIEIATLIDELAASAPDLHSGAVEISVFIDPALPGILMGDRRRLQQILLQLLDNARKFTEIGGIAIKVSGIPGPGGDFLVRFEVHDSGIGIAPEHMSKLFDNFTKVASPLALASPGAGIGLAISQKLVRYLAGEIGVESTPGTGSTFWFTIPCVRGSAAPDVYAHELLSGLRVLVVDDVTVSRDTMSEQISAWGATVEVASLGVEAMASLRRAVEGGNAIDVAVVDNHAESMNGLALAATIRNDLRLENLKILLNSQTDIPMQTLRNTHPNVTWALTKPIRPADLRNHLLEASAAKFVSE